MIHPRVTMNGMTNNAICWGEGDKFSMLHVTGHTIVEERERTYDTASNSNTQTQSQLVLDRNRNSGDVLSSVSNDGEQDQANELFRDPTTTSQPVDRIDKPFSSNGDKDRNHNEKADGHRQRQLWHFFILLIRFSRTMFHVISWLRVGVGVGVGKMSATTCRFLPRRLLFHGGEVEEFPRLHLRLLLHAWSGVRSVLDRLRLFTELAIVQTLVGKELEDEVRDVNLNTKEVNPPP